MKINKLMLSKLIAKDLKINDSKANVILTSISKIIFDQLAEGNDVFIGCLGMLKSYVRKGRIGINPQTLDPLPLPPKRVVKFRESLYLKKEMAQLHSRSK